MVHPYQKFDVCFFWHAAHTRSSSALTAATPPRTNRVTVGPPAFWRLSEAHVKTKKQRDAEEYEKSELDRLATERRKKKAADFVVHVEDQYGNLVDARGKPVSGNPLIEL